MVIIEMSRDDRFHDVTRNQLYGSGKVVQFEAPTGTGKSYMVCDSEMGDEDRLLIVPSFTQTEQIARKYGIKHVNGDVQDLEIDETGFGCVVSTYDGLRRLCARIDTSGTYLFVDEAHQLSEAACYRHQAIDFIIQNFHRFKGVVLMSATPKSDSPIQPDAAIKVTRDEDPVPTHLTECTDVIAIGMELFEKDDIETVVISMNDKAKIGGVAEVLRAMGETVGIITSDNSDTQHVKDLLSGKVRTRWILGTNSMNDGIDIDPRSFSLIISQESHISSNSVQQVASRFRNGVEFFRPARLIISRPMHDMTITAPSDFPQLGQVLEEVQGYCERLDALHKYLRRIGESSQPINRSINYQYDRMVHFEYDDEGEVESVTPSYSACVGRVEERTTRMMTSGDLLSQIAKYGFYMAGYMTIGEDNEAPHSGDVSEAKKEAGQIVKRQVNEFVGHFIDTACESPSDANRLLNERLGPATSRNFGKKEVEAAKHIKIASRAILATQGASMADVAKVIEAEGCTDVASLKILSKKSQRHAVISDVMRGQGRRRDDAQFLRALYEAYSEGDEFTKDDVSEMITALDGDRHKLLVPKNRITLMRQLFTIKPVRFYRDGINKRGYSITRKGLVHDWITKK